MDLNVELKCRNHGRNRSKISAEIDGRTPTKTDSFSQILEVLMAIYQILASAKCKCGRRQQFIVNRDGRQLAQSDAVDHAARRGWKLGWQGKVDRCPTCSGWDQVSSKVKQA